jgi:hypothetical protein
MSACEEVVVPIGQVYVWLGLAVPDNKSPFGFSATSRLMGALVGQTNHRGRRVRTEPSADDDRVFYSILDVVRTGSKHFTIVQDALVAAGLAVKTKGNKKRYIPTTKLRKMVHNRGMLDLALDHGLEIEM